MTREKVSTYLIAPTNMRLCAVVLIFAICLTSFSSPGTILLTSHENGMTAIIALDVCHGSGSGIVPAPDMPGNYEYAGPIFHVNTPETYLTTDVSFQAFLPDFREERPPRG